MRCCAVSMPTLLELQRGFLSALLDGSLEPARGEIVAATLGAGSAACDLCEQRRGEFHREPAAQLPRDPPPGGRRLFQPMRARVSRRGIRHVPETCSMSARRFPRFGRSATATMSFAILRISRGWSGSTRRRSPPPITRPSISGGSAASRPRSTAACAFGCIHPRGCSQSDYPALAIWQANVGSDAEPEVIDLGQGADRLLSRARRARRRDAAGPATANSHFCNSSPATRRSARRSTRPRRATPNSMRPPVCAGSSSIGWSSISLQPAPRTHRQVDPMPALDKILAPDRIAATRARSAASARGARRPLVRQLAISEIRLDQAQFLGRDAVSVRKRIPHTGAVAARRPRLPELSANCSFPACSCSGSRAASGRSACSRSMRWRSSPMRTCCCPRASRPHSRSTCCGARSSFS